MTKTQALLPEWLCSEQGCNEIIYNASLKDVRDHQKRHELNEKAG